MALTIIFASVSVWEYSEIGNQKATTIKISSTNTTSTLTACTTPTSTSPNLSYGSCLAVSGDSLSATSGEMVLVLTFSMYGAPDLGVASMTLTGPTIQGVCGFAGNALPNNGTITKLPGGSGGQITFDVSGCRPTGNSVVSANDSYAYTLVTDWEAGAVFTRVVVAHYIVGMTSSDSCPAQNCWTAQRKWPELHHTSARMPVALSRTRTRSAEIFMRARHHWSVCERSSNPTLGM